MKHEAPAGEAVRREYALMRLLQRIAIAANEARTVESALQTCLDEVCAHTGWPVGHAYLLDEDSGEFVPTGVWHLADGRRFLRFRERTAATRITPGEGVLGRVLQTGQPTWIPDVSRDPTFLRGRSGEIGVRTARAFPILVGPEVVGVLEFYSVEAIDPDESLLGIMSQVGVQIGRVVERVRAERALQASEAKFAGIISTSSDAIISVDEQQHIILYNRGAKEIFGYTTDEILGEHLDILIPGPFRDAHRDHLRGFGVAPASSRLMGERGEISGRRKSGEVFPAEASMSRLDIEGQGRMYTVVLRDVTERVRAAEELARSNAELEQFAYVASHDLQEPLRMVASYTQLLARRYHGRLDSDADEFIGFAVEGVKRMQALINDLLAFSRVGTRGGAFERVDGELVLARVLENLAPALEEADAAVTHDHLPTVTADAVQLGQVFQNLIANAVKFHKPGSRPCIHVSAERSPDGWVFSVTDKGIGIEPEYMDRIFVLFQRLHSRAEYPGTGIGLAMCKKIVERHGGRIWLESEPGEGTIFYFSIPDHRSEPT